MSTAPFIHESAYVDDGAQVGAGSKIWHFCHVMSGAVIGERSSLGQNVVVMNGTKIGNNVKIQNNVSIYEGVELEDDVFCGPSMVFTNVINPRSAVSRKDEYRRTLVRRGASIGANATIVCVLRTPGSPPISPLTRFESRPVSSTRTIATKSHSPLTDIASATPSTAASSSPK